MEVKNMGFFSNDDEDANDEKPISTGSGGSWLNIDKDTSDELMKDIKEED